MAMSGAERNKFNKLFEVEEFIPPEILDVVKKSSLRHKESSTLTTKRSRISFKLALRRFAR